MRRLWIVLVALASFTFTGCYDFSMFEDIEIEPVTQTWVLPVMKSTITFKELVERSEANTVVNVMPNSSLFYISFRDTTDFALASDQFNFPSFLFSQLASVPGGLPPTFPLGTQASYAQDFESNFEAIPGVELKRVDFLAGTARVRIQNTLHHAVSGQLVITSLEASNGSPITIPFSLQGGGSSLTDNYFLNDLFLNLFSAPSSYNKFRFNLSFTVTSSGSSDGSGGIDVQIEFVDPDWELFIGKIDSSVDTGEQVHSIAVFNATVLASQHFAEPTILYTIQNSYGLPVDFVFSQFEVSSNMGITIPLVNEGTLDASGLNLSGPNSLNYVEQFNEPFAVTTFLLNKDNSNVEDIFDIAPNKLKYRSSLTMGDGSSSYDRFVRKDSKIRFLSDISLPLDGWATTHLLSDTLENADFPSIDSLGFIDSMDYKITLKFKFENELPMNMKLMVEFLDDDDQVVETLFPDGEHQLVEAAPVDANGQSTGSRSLYSLVELSKERYNRMGQASHMILYYRFDTGESSGQSVRILSTNKAVVQMSAIVKITLNPQSF